VARCYGCSLSTISTLKRRLSAELLESFGEDILLEVARRPEWQSSGLGHPLKVLNERPGHSFPPRARCSTKMRNHRPLFGDPVQQMFLVESVSLIRTVAGHAQRSPDFQTTAARRR